MEPALKAVLRQMPVSSRSRPYMLEHLGYDALISCLSALVYVIDFYFPAVLAM